MFEDNHPTPATKRIGELVADVVTTGSRAQKTLAEDPTEENVEAARKALRDLRDLLHLMRDQEGLVLQRDRLIGVLREQTVRKLSMAAIADDAGIDDSNATKRAEAAGFFGRRTKRRGRVEKKPA